MKLEVVWATLFGLENFSWEAQYIVLKLVEPFGESLAFIVFPYS